ncbi:MAG: class I SAM-dependent methyltransferase [Pirellulales bacterium]
MFASAEYELIDFGGGRKLERFGPYLLDRPSPAAEGEIRQHAGLWSQAAARFERTSADRGIWIPGDDAPRLPERWQIRHGNIVLELKATPAGHLGVFPEQAANWDWLAAQIAAAAGPVKVLNLFAYTGGSTLAAAAAGAEVTHVDAARNTIAWARRNAELSALTGAPIRWIADDAATFVRRELKRGSRYDIVLLDPPSYGHGVKGKVWKLADSLSGLLTDCARRLVPERRWLLLTCHTPGYGPIELRELVAQALPHADIECAPLLLATSSGGTLMSGAMARLRTWRDAN